MFEIYIVKFFKTDIINKYMYAFRIKVIKREIIKQCTLSEIHAEAASFVVFFPKYTFIIKD